MGDGRQGRSLGSLCTPTEPVTGALASASVLSPGAGPTPNHPSTGGEGPGGNKKIGSRKL